MKRRSIDSIKQAGYLLGKDVNLIILIPKYIQINL